MNADGEAELLAGDGIYQGLENAGEAGRFNPPKGLDQRLQSPILSGKAIKSFQIGVQAQHLLQRDFEGRGCVRCFQAFAPDLDLQLGGIGGPGLEDGHQHRFLLNHQDSLVRPAVPAIHQIMGAPPQHPGGQIQAEGGRSERARTRCWSRASPMI